MSTICCSHCWGTPTVLTDVSLFGLPDRIIRLMLCKKCFSAERLKIGDMYYEVKWKMKVNRESQ